MPQELVVSGEAILAPVGKGASSEWAEARRAALVDALRKAQELAAAASVQLGGEFRILEVAVRVTITFEIED